MEICEILNLVLKMEEGLLDEESFKNGGEFSLSGDDDDDWDDDEKGNQEPGKPQFRSNHFIDYRSMFRGTLSVSFVKVDCNYTPRFSL